MGVAIRQGICIQCVYRVKITRDKADKRCKCGCVDSKAFEKTIEDPEHYGCRTCFLQVTVEPTK